MEDGRVLTNEDFKEGQYYSGKELKTVEFDDYGHLFRTNEAFDTREEAQDWVYNVGHKNNMFFTISSSKKDRVYLGCEREDEYEEPKVDENENLSKKKRKSRGTKKCGCKFQVKLNYRFEKWFVRMDPNRGRHNHKLGKYGNWHKSYTRLLASQEAEIESLTNDNMKPQAILNRMQKKNPGMNLRQINNARVKLNKKKRGCLSKISLLFKMLCEKNYMSWARDEEDGSKALTDIVFAHPDAIKLLRKFPQVIIMDGTYSTNLYKFPLIEIIGVCSTGKNYHLAFAFVKKEVKDNFLFVMRAVRDMYSYAERVNANDVKGPLVILTDRELACMNALVEVFPNANHFLCRRHISVDVRKHISSFAKVLYPSNSTKSVMWANAFSKRWNKLVSRPTVADYEECLKEIKKEWSKFPSILEYIHKTWLDPYRERFVSAWTDKVMHYGNTTTNRVEGAHSQLKRWFGTSRGSLVTCFKKIDELVVLQFGEIKTQFELSLAVHLHIIAYAVYRLLGGEVTHKAIDLLLDEGSSKGDCTCVLPISHGLPCKCQMESLVKQDRPIELGMVDSFWRMMDMEEDEKKVILTPTTKEVVEQAWVQFSAGSHSESTLYMASSLLYKMAVPEACDYEEPHHVKPKGRPKNSLGSRYKSAFEAEEISARRKWDASKSQMEGVDENEESEKESEPENDKEKEELVVFEGSVRGRERGINAVRGRGRGRGRGREMGRGRGRGINASSGRGRGGRRSRGRGRGRVNVGSVVDFPYGNEVPRCIYDFIELYLNVIMDGNCGFRALAFCHYNDEERWDDVRKDLLNELIKHRAFWDKYVDVEKAIDRLDYHEAPGSNKRYWFEFVTLGNVVATVYQAAVFCFSQSNPITFLPVRCDDELNLKLPLKEYGVGRIRSIKHFVVLGVSSNCPIPPVFKNWKKMAQPNLHKWAEGFGDRIRQFEELETVVHPSVNPKQIFIELDP